LLRKPPLATLRKPVLADAGGASAFLKLSNAATPKASLRWMVDTLKYEATG